MDPSAVSDGASSHSKRKHKHHHHHHHHGDKHHHHHHHRRRHHSRHHRAKSAESIRNRVQPNFISADPSMQQQQPQQMIVYREGYPAESNPATLATVPYMANEQEIAYHDDQQAPMFVYRDSAPPIIQNDGTSQHIFIQPEQETVKLLSISLIFISIHLPENCSVDSSSAADSTKSRLFTGDTVSSETGRISAYASLHRGDRENLC